MFKNECMLRFRLHFLPDMPKLKLNFRKVVRQHMYGMVRSIMIFLEIYLAFQQWKKFENPRITDKVITMSLVFYFLGHSVHAPSALSPSTARSRRRCQTGYSSCSVTSGLLQHYLSTYLGVDIASLQRVWHAAARTVLNLRLNDHVCLRRCVVRQTLYV